MVEIASWIVSQLASYGMGPWALFLLIVCFAGIAFRMPGVILGHLVVVGLIVVLDVRWVQAEMRNPAWDGQPDQDFVFFLGVAIRILLINVILAPVSLGMLRLRRRHRSGDVLAGN